MKTINYESVCTSDAEILGARKCVYLGCENPVREARQEEKMECFKEIPAKIIKSGARSAPRKKIGVFHPKK